MVFINLITLTRVFNSSKQYLKKNNNYDDCITRYTTCSLDPPTTSEATLHVHVYVHLTNTHTDKLVQLLD